MAKQNDFFDQVYAVVRQVPKGRVTTYGAIARFLGSAQSSRMVGYAMNASFALDDVPAQRVVNRLGLLTGKHHFGTPTRMQELLEAEGVRVQNDQVQDFDQLFWSPEMLLG